MNKQWTTNMIAFLIVLSGMPLHAQQKHHEKTSGKLVVNTADSKVNWIGKKPLGEHTGYVRLTSGTLNVEKGVLKGGSFVIDLNSIVDLDLTDETWNAKLIGHLKSADFFDVQKYPTSRFVITKATRLSDAATGAAYSIEGNLTIKDITKKISFQAQIKLDKGKFTATAAPFTINRTDWGVNYQSKSVIAGLKDQFIYDDITLSIELSAN
jgi:polyisoprenoid-binding protein YceI